MPEISPSFFASPQIQPEDLPHIKEAGFSLVVNNRPDGEEAGQTSSAEIEKACAELGLDYHYLPIDSRGISPESIQTLQSAISSHTKIFAYCRSGMRSAALHAIAQCALGENPQETIALAADAGFDLSHLSGLLEQAHQGHSQA